MQGRETDTITVLLSFTLQPVLIHQHFASTGKASPKNLSWNIFRTADLEAWGCLTWCWQKIVKGESFHAVIQIFLEFSSSNLKFKAILITKLNSRSPVLTADIIRKKVSLEALLKNGESNCVKSSYSSIWTHQLQGLRHTRKQKKPHSTVEPILGGSNTRKFWLHRGFWFAIVKSP